MKFTEFSLGQQKQQQQLKYMQNRQQVSTDINFQSAIYHSSFPPPPYTHTIHLSSLFKFLILLLVH